MYEFTKDQKAQLKELVAFAKSKMKTATKTDVVEIEPKKTEEQVKEYLDKKNAKRNPEIRMKCNVCGHIFCYTQRDLEINKNNASMASLSNIASLASAIGGTRYDMYEQDKIADKYTSQIVDYSRCPSCNSTNLVQLSDDELSASSQNTSDSALSPADEIMKYKELLDCGIITQSEFDKKKKQLLGL